MDPRVLLSVVMGYMAESFDSEVYTKSAAVVDFVYTSESNESCEKHSTQR